MDKLKEIAPRRAVVLKIDKFSTRDGTGIRTVVFLKGCPLRCKWCHSPESWSFEIQKYLCGEQIGIEMSTDDVLAEVLKDIDFYEASGGGLTVSGGEVLAHPEFAIDLLAKAKNCGLHTAIETSGFAPKGVVEKFLPLVDMWLWDVKHLDAQKHLEYTCRALVPILENLELVNSFITTRQDLGQTIILRCPMIMGVNDDDSELEAIGQLADRLEAVSEIDVEPYIPFGIDKARRLNLPVFEFKMPPFEYGEAIASKLAKLTRKRVRVP